MKEIKLKRSKGDSYYIKKRGLPKGCKLCLRGSKAVLFLNGLCQNPEHCRWYCPLSLERKNKSDTYIDEIKVFEKEDLIDEINKINAKGMSITGGEPLSPQNLEKTLEYIKYVKNKKGDKFHVHLYTNGMNFNSRVASKLSEVGLDEIRFHPPQEKWNVIKDAMDMGFIVGAELPLIPEKEYIRKLEDFIYYLDKIGADFINLNEFEYCVSNSDQLKQRGFKLQIGSIASVEDSKEQAIILIKKVASNVSIKIHYCSILAKDYWQLRERYLRRAKRVKKTHEYITEEGLLMFAQIEGPSSKIRDFYEILRTDFMIPDDLILFQDDKIELELEVGLNNDIIKRVADEELEIYVMEVTPFKRELYRQITEKTPINIFKEEFDINED